MSLIIPVIGVSGRFGTTPAWPCQGQSLEDMYFTRGVYSGKSKSTWIASSPPVVGIARVPTSCCGCSGEICRAEAVVGLAGKSVMMMGKVRTSGSVWVEEKWMAIWQRWEISKNGSKWCVRSAGCVNGARMKWVSELVAKVGG